MALCATASAEATWIQGPTVYDAEGKEIAALSYMNDYVVDAESATVNFDDSYRIELRNGHTFGTGDRITWFFYASDVDVSADG